MITNLPFENPQPNGNEFIDIILGKVPQTRTPLIEYSIDDVVLKPIVTDLLGRKWVDAGNDRESQKAHLDNFIQVWYRLGYDFVRFERGLPFDKRILITDDIGSDKTKERTWVDLSIGNITSWEEFEKYPWPKVEEVDFFSVEYLNSNLPEGMGLLTCHAAGVLENLSQLMSYEGLCMALFDDQELVQAVVDKVGELLFGYYEHLVELDNVIAIFQGDDMGFRTSTLISPDDLRKYTFPWLKKLSALVHDHDLPYFLHSCGQLETIYEDLISDIKIDAKHSYEDVITPVEDFQKLYGNRIGVLGGVDLNILTEGSEDDIRKRVRYLVETCGGRGRYALGSGNSIPSYVPVNNYLTMLDELAECNK